MIQYCIPKDHVAILIPYANRPLHLRTLLYNLNQFLEIQQLHYAFYVIEPLPEQTFNRGKLLNIGYVEARKDFDWNCTISHDVDLLPQSLLISYACSYENPGHLGAYVDQLDYNLHHEKMFGGVSSMTKEQFEKCNGYPNQFWGWGGEDDDLSARVFINGYKLERVKSSARYTMIKHRREKGNPVNHCRWKLLDKVNDRWLIDGLNSLQYKLVKKERQPLFTWIYVDLMEAESRQQLAAEKIC